MLFLQIASGFILGVGGVMLICDYLCDKRDLKLYKELHKEYSEKYYEAKKECVGLSKELEKL